MKKIIVFVSVFVLCLSSLITVASAETYPSRLTDNADLLTSSEEAAVEQRIKEIRDEHNIDVIILLEDGLFEGYNDTYALSAAMSRYCINYYSKHSLSDNGVMLLISLDDGYKDYYFYTVGSCSDHIDNYSDIDYIENSVQPLISSERFYDACMKYLDLSEYCLTNSSSFSGGEKVDPFSYLPAVIIVAFLIALISVFVMKSQLKTVRPKTTASDYSMRDTFKLTSAADIFLYRNITKTPKPRDTSSGRMGGGSRGGGGRGGRGGRC